MKTSTSRTQVGSVRSRLFRKLSEEYRVCRRFISPTSLKEDRTRVELGLAQFWSDNSVRNIVCVLYHRFFALADTVHNLKVCINVFIKNQRRETERVELAWRLVRGTFRGRNRTAESVETEQCRSPSQYLLFLGVTFTSSRLNHKSTLGTNYCA